MQYPPNMINKPIEPPQFGQFSAKIPIQQQQQQQQPPPQQQQQTTKFSSMSRFDSNHQDTITFESAIGPNSTSSSAHALIMITNITARCELMCRLNLPFLARTLPNTEYHPERNPGLLVRFKDPAVSVSIFKSGKISIAGARSEYVARIVSRHVARLIQRAGHPAVTYQNFNIYAISASYDFGQTINLSTFRSKVGEDKVENHYSGMPAIVYRPGEEVTLIVFETGKIVFKGQNRESIFEAMRITYPALMASRVGL